MVNNLLKDYNYNYFSFDFILPITKILGLAASLNGIMSFYVLWYGLDKKDGKRDILYQMKEDKEAKNFARSLSLNPSEKLDPYTMW